MKKRSSIHTLKEGKKVLLLGDTILDVYTYCNVVCEALYARIPEVEESRTQVSFGGNSLIANNLLELGGSVTFISVIGNDDAAKQYKTFNHPNLRKLFLVDPERKTTVKQRWFADGKALLQANTVDNHDLSRSLEQKVLALLAKEIPQTDVVVVMDPQHGFLTENIVRKAIMLCKKNHKPLYVDVQISHRASRHEMYRGAHTFFLNTKEAKSLYPKFNMRKPEAALRAIVEKLGAENGVIKLGAEGSAALIDGVYVRTPSHNVDAVDVCGAGDAFLAAFSLTDTSNPHDALSVANAWGALSTTIHGTIPPKKQQLKKILRKAIDAAS